MLLRVLLGLAHRHHLGVALLREPNLDGRRLGQDQLRTAGIMVLMIDSSS